MSTENLLFPILIMAAATFLTRFLPFALFHSGQKIPSLICYLGEVLPMALMAMLVVTSLRHVLWFQGTGGIPEILALALTALVHRWKGNSLLSITSGTVFYMFLVQKIFC